MSEYDWQEGQIEDVDEYSGRVYEVIVSIYDAEDPGMRKDMLDIPAERLDFLFYGQSPTAWALRP